MPAEVKQNSAAPPPPAPPAAPAAGGATADRPGVSEYYRHTMLALEERRQQIGLSMCLASDLVGIADRRWSKNLYADAPRSGKVARWTSIDEMLEALMPDGYRLRIEPRPGPKLTAFLLKHRIRNAASISDRRLLRQIMQERGRLGGLATKAKLTRAQRIRLAKRASKFRNQRLDAERRSALARHAVSVRNGRMTAEQRKESARRAARARWSKADGDGGDR